MESKNATYRPKRFNPNISELDPKWFAISTKYKCEKYVASALAKKSIESYLPLIERIKRYERKIKKYKVPLINSYLFVSITKEQYVKVLETEYVLKFVKQGTALIAIPEEEIDLLRRIVGESEQIAQIEHKYYVGSNVELVSGSLTGIKGIVTEINNKKEFVVSLENMGVTFRLQVSEEHLSLVS